MLQKHKHVPKPVGNGELAGRRGGGGGGGGGEQGIRFQFPLYDHLKLMEFEDEW